MQLRSINVGMPQQIRVQYGTVLTSIFKRPVEGRIAVRRHNIDGDRQSDLTVHGGPNKAVYAYPFEHYAYWREQLPNMDLPPGVFGENLTTEGILEIDTHIGDEFRIGAAVLRVTQPRMPCYKLNLRFGRPDMVKRFWHSGRSGIYFSIVEEGEFQAGDTITCVLHVNESISVADVVRLYMREETSVELFQRALRSPISGSWKEELRERWQA